MTFKRTILPTAAAVAALAFAAVAATPTLAQMKEQTVTVGGAPMYPSKNIIQNAVNSKDHTTLVAAVKAAGLVDTLQGSGPFTVFAPTNAAFAKLPAGTVDSLLKPQMKEKLVAVLTYHVLPGRLSVKDLGSVQQGRRQGQVQDGRRRRAHGRVQGPGADHPRLQGQRLQGHRPECLPVERRHPRDRQRADAELTTLRAGRRNPRPHTCTDRPGPVAETRRASSVRAGDAVGPRGLGAGLASAATDPGPLRPGRYRLPAIPAHGPQGPAGCRPPRPVRGSWPGTPGTW